MTVPASMDGFSSPTFAETLHAEFCVHTPFWPTSSGPYDSHFDVLAYLKTTAPDLEQNYLNWYIDVPNKQSADALTSKIREYQSCQSTIAQSAYPSEMLTLMCVLAVLVLSAVACLFLVKRRHSFLQTLDGAAVESSAGLLRGIRKGRKALSRFAARVSEKADADD